MSNWATRNLRFDAGWVRLSELSVSNDLLTIFIQAALESGGKIGVAHALAMASSNIEKLLGIKLDAVNTDLAVTMGGDLFSFESKVVAMISPRRELVDLL